MMFWRIIKFACEIGEGCAKDEIERGWVKKLYEFMEDDGSYSPDLNAEEFFEGPEELEFWGKVLNILADGIYNRTIGNQDDQSWQVATIWAAVDLSRLLFLTSRYIQNRK